jgi:hypothetical protein
LTCGNWSPAHTGEHASFDWGQVVAGSNPVSPTQNVQVELLHHRIVLLGSDKLSNSSAAATSAKTQPVYGRPAHDGQDAVPVPVASIN